MKIYVVNDTSHYHSGCSAVIWYIRHKVYGQGHEIHYSHRGGVYSSKAVENCDVILCNGEGTLHHRPDHPILKPILYGQELGKKTYLVNSVWDGMEGDHSDWLSKLDGLVLRESMSQEHMHSSQGVNAEVLPDFSYFCPINEGSPFFDLKNNVVYGDWHLTDPFDAKYMKDKTILTMKSGKWSTLIKSLRTAKLYVTGRHHGVYAACKAKIPFVAYDHNSHKIPGLFKSAGVDIPIPTNKKEVLEAIDWASKNHHVYKTLFDWLDSQKEWTGIQ